MKTYLCVGAGRRFPAALFFLHKHDPTQGPTDPVTGYGDDHGEDNDDAIDNDYDDDMALMDTTMTTTARTRTTLMLLHEELSSFGRCCVWGSQLYHYCL